MNLLDMKRNIIFLVLALATVAWAEDSKIRVYAFAVLDYADDPKELSDSVKDLTKEIGKRKHLEVVGTAEAADIVVEILHRRKERRTELSYENWDRERFETTDWRIVSYRMTAGEFKHQAEVEGKSWRQAAGRLSKEVERWAKENRARLLALPQ